MGLINFPPMAAGMSCKRCMPQSINLDFSEATNYTNNYGVRLHTSTGKHDGFRDTLMSLEVAEVGRAAT